MIEFIVCFIAGLGAGLGTGFAGISAVTVIAPMLVTFLDMPAYSATGIGLASDVLASAASAYTYKKNKNVDIKNALIMMTAVLSFTLVGSYVAKFVPNTALGSMSIFMTTLLGIRFIVCPVMTTKEAMLSVSHRRRAIQSLIGGVAIGFICGFMGAGGGLMMLLILTTVMGYELKTAVGTSVFIMTFTALTGALGHFVIDGHMPDVVCLAVCIGSTLLWATVASHLANKATPKTLNRLTGIVLTVLGVVIILVRFVIK